MVDQGMLNKASELMTRFGAIATPPNIYSQMGANNDPKAKFPLQIGSTDPQDRKFKLQNQMVGAGNATGAVRGYGQAVVGDEFFGWAQRKQDQAMLFDFYDYMLSNADLTKPESAQWWFNKFPWMKDLRLREVEREAEVQKRLAKISICGPESEEDFMVLFMKDQGMLTPSEKPLYRINELDAAGFNATKDFTRGAFNPFSVKRPLPGNMADVRKNWADPLGGAPPGTPIPSPFAGTVQNPPFNLPNTLGIIPGAP